MKPPLIIFPAILLFILTFSIAKSGLTQDKNLPIVKVRPKSHWVDFYQEKITMTWLKTLAMKFL